MSEDCRCVGGVSLNTICVLFFVAVLCFCWWFVNVCVCSAGLDFLKNNLFVRVCKYRVSSVTS